MPLCFECFCKNGIEATSIQKLAEACGMSSGNIFHYFRSKDEIIIESTAYCMAKVEDDFMQNAPESYDDIKRFIKEVPYWTAKQHGEKYRFMYQVYTSPQYRQYGKEFFKGVRERYTDYAKSLEPKLGIPWRVLQSSDAASGRHASFDRRKIQREIIRIFSDFNPRGAAGISICARVRKAY